MLYVCEWSVEEDERKERWIHVGVFMRVHGCVGMMVALATMRLSGEDVRSEITMLFSSGLRHSGHAVGVWCCFRVCQSPQSFPGTVYSSILLHGNGYYRFKVTIHTSNYIPLESSR